MRHRRSTARSVHVEAGMLYVALYVACAKYTTVSLSHIVMVVHTGPSFLEVHGQLSHKRTLVFLNWGVSTLHRVLTRGTPFTSELGGQTS